MKKSLKILGISLALFLAAALTVQGTLAFLSDKADPVENAFTKAYVTSEVNWGNGVATVTNTGNAQAFVRAVIAVNWADAANNVYGIAPAASDYSLSLNTADWEYADGYYYYKHPIDPLDTTNPLVNTVTVTGTAPSASYRLSVEVAAEAIQAEGMGAANAREAWEKAAE